MSVMLWRHQREAVQAAHTAVSQGRKRGLWVMPTGSGKTVAFVTLAREMNRPTLVVVHRDELLRQAADEFRRSWPGVRIGTLPGQGWEEAPVVVATVQSLRSRLKGIAKGRFGLVVIDEAHHASRHRGSG
jgi:superfamily II DNA or RNA helicase